jgi:hypothetical protein
MFAHELEQSMLRHPSAFSLPFPSALPSPERSTRSSHSTQSNGLTTEGTTFVEKRWHPSESVAICARARADWPPASRLPVFGDSTPERGRQNIHGE